jgi:hypothetical protein
VHYHFTRRRNAIAPRPVGEGAIIFCPLLNLKAMPTRHETGASIVPAVIENDLNNFDVFSYSPNPGLERSFKTVIFQQNC